MINAPAANNATKPDTLPVVSVVVPTCNRPEMLRATLSSILSQTLHNLELIVVSDGLDNETRSVVESFDESRVVFIEQPAAGRPSVPRNRGIALARGQFVALCDDDDVWSPEKLHKQVALMEKHPEAGLCYTNSVTLRDGRVGNTPRIRPGEFARNFTGLIWRNSICNSSVLLRREIFETVGLLDEDPRLSPFDDYEMWLRIAHRYPLVYLDEPLVTYRVHDRNIVARFAERELIVIRALRAARRKLRTHHLLFSLSIALRYGKYIVSALRGHEYRIR